MRIQADGLSGRLDEFWPDIRDSGWIGGCAEGWRAVTPPELPGRCLGTDGAPTLWGMLRLPGKWLGTDGRPARTRRQPGLTDPISYLGWVSISRAAWQKKGYTLHSTQPSRSGLPSPSKSPAQALGPWMVKPMGSP